MIVLPFLALAAIGSVIRWKASKIFGTYKGTFTVNTVGSFCLGLITDLNDPMLTIIGVGGLAAAALLRPRTETKSDSRA